MEKKILGKKKPHIVPSDNFYDDKGSVHLEPEYFVDDTIIQPEHTVASRQKQDVSQSMANKVTTKKPKEIVTGEELDRRKDTITGGLIGEDSEKKVAEKKAKEANQKSSQPNFGNMLVGMAGSALAPGMSGVAAMATGQAKLDTSALDASLIRRGLATPTMMANMGMTPNIGMQQDGEMSM